MKEYMTPFTSWIMSTERKVEILTLWYPGVDLIGKQDLCRCNKVKMRSLRQNIIPFDFCPFKKRKIPYEDTDVQGETGRDSNDAQVC